MKKKPVIVGRGRGVIPKISCPECGCLFHPEYSDSNRHLISSLCFENFCPVCGIAIDKSTLSYDVNKVMREEKSLSDLRRN